MNFLLTEEFDDSFEWKDKKYHIDLSFDNVLLLFELFKDDLIEEAEKPLIAIDMLIKEVIPEFNSYEEAIELFEYLMKEFLGIDGNQDKNSEDKKVFDFNKDAGFIYASFYSDYGIDLFEMKGKMHWRKFITLLNNLGDKTKFKQVVEYRVMDIPTGDGVSQEYKDHIIKMKELYSLDDITPQERIENVLDSFADIMKNNAKVVKDDGG